MKYAVYSIRRRLLIVLGLAISIAFFAQAGISYRVALREVDDISDYHMLQIAFAVKRGVPDPALSPRDHFPAGGEDRSFSLKFLPLTEQQQAWALAHENTPGRFATSAPFEHGFSTRLLGDKTFRVFAIPAQNRLIEVMQDMSVRSSTARKLALRTVLPTLILGPLLLLIVWWGISRALRPLMFYRDAIARRDANDLQALSTEGVPEEILPFISGINALFGRIGNAFAAQQNFVADAAHELRSPLAALRLQVQGLQRASSDEMRALAIERVMGGIDRATRLIEQLLVLAREEATVPERAEVCLPQVMRLALSDVLPLAQQRQIDIGANLADAGPDAQFYVAGNADALRILLRNLLENAVKYTPPQGVVNLSLLREEGLVLVVEDSGPGIPAEAREQVFKRFQRGSARASDGSGLGLSIVQAIADRHHLRVVLDQSQTLGGLLVKLVFPQA
ncbi:MAG: two-component sensor histidine kinase [Proteobacteria bacterium]|nr:two-component sensor histidine kinase [Pseudomonadota bacterium]